MICRKKNTAASRLLNVIIMASLIIGLGITPPAFADDDDDDASRGINSNNCKNVIILIPDGCSQSIQTLSRWYKDAMLAVDGIQVGAVKHEMADSVITDSAAAATAFATGVKTSNGFLGVAPDYSTLLSRYVGYEPPDTEQYEPLASVMEGAKLKGKATGLVVTCRFSHATPAAWASHHHKRGDEAKAISEHIVYNELDLVFGGGNRNLDPSYRSDGEDLAQVLKDRGYTIVEDRAGMNAVNRLPVYGMFAYSHMSPEIDRPYDTPDEPSLAEMTEKAIKLLSQDRQGFILMVEGSQVDWAGHNNDPIYMVTDFIEFDEAVKVALDFAKKDRRTLVLAYPDHNTGGMDIGNRARNWDYTGTTVEELIDPILGMTRTANAVIAAMNGNYSFNSVQQVIKDLWNITISMDDYNEMINVMDSEGASESYALARESARTILLLAGPATAITRKMFPSGPMVPELPKGCWTIRNWQRWLPTHSA